VLHPDDMFGAVVAFTDVPAGDLSTLPSL
jgi:hypothetical protein